MPEGELAQEDPQRRRRIHLVEENRGTAGADRVHIVDAVRSGEHPADDRGQFPHRVRRTRGHPRGGEVDMAVDQLRQSGLLAQFEDRNQPGRGHEIVFVEHRGPSRERVR
nr:hypothetical protein [Rhodococcus oxybenzonivorans]